MVFQADICILDIDKGKITLPEDIPSLPNKEELISKLNDVINKPLPKADPFSTLKFSAVSSPISPSSNQNTASQVFSNRRSLQRPPKLRFIRQSQVESREKSLEEQPHAVHESNLKIRHVFLDYLCRIFQSYDKFIIYPPDRKRWNSNRENMENFERDVFLCDQPQQNLTFLSKFLETNIFSSFIDLKILSSFNEYSEKVNYFDNRIEHIRRLSVCEIKSPTCEGKNFDDNTSNIFIYSRAP